MNIPVPAPILVCVEGGCAQVNPVRLGQSMGLIVSRKTDSTMFKGCGSTTESRMCFRAIAW